MEKLLTSIKSAARVSATGAILAIIAFLPVCAATYVIFKVFGLDISFVKLEAITASIAFIAFFAHEVYLDDTFSKLFSSRERTIA